MFMHIQQYVHISTTDFPQSDS